MLTLLALHLKCPTCTKSLMDEEHHLDNHSSVNLNIEADGKKGWIRISSVYGSYNISSKYKIPDGSIAKFFCPECTSELTSSQNCGLCKSPMVPLQLDEGGKVYFCSKRGCKKHLIEFEEAENALTKFYQNYSIGANHSHSNHEKIFSSNTEEEGKKELIANKTFLNTYCPFCRKSLIETGTINFVVKNKNHHEGMLSLSPYLNIFTHKSTIEIPEGEEVSDLKCFHCKRSLVEESLKCESCGSHTAHITVSAMRKLIPFYICMKKGCIWHGLSNEDTNLIALEDSLEW